MMLVMSLPTLFQKNLLKAMKQLLKEPILPTLVHQKLLKFQWLTKVWDDKENKDGLRPEKVTIRLLADGQEVAVKEITTTDNWQASFTDLPEYKDGKKIVYTITEDPVAGYTSKIDGFTVTNRHIPPTTPSYPNAIDDTTNHPAKHTGETRNSNYTKRRKEKNLPSTGEVIAYGLTILGALLAIFALALLSCVVNGKRNKLHTDKESGTEIGNPLEFDFVVPSAQ